MLTTVFNLDGNGIHGVYKLINYYISGIPRKISELPLHSSDDDLSTFTLSGSSGAFPLSLSPQRIFLEVPGALLPARSMY